MKGKISVLISAILLAFTFALTAAAQVPPAKPGSDLSLVQSRNVTLDGANIFYQSHGKGDEALVLIHGWSSNLDFWKGSASELGKRYRVIALDLPGHGKSDKPQVTYSMDYFARAVDAVMNDAGAKRAVLVGHSMGTPIARQFYRKFPEKTLAIVIVDGALRPFGDKKLMEGFLAGLRGPNFREAGKQMFTGMSGPSLSAELHNRS